MAVSNTDDHFRNHGFLLAEDGWTLSPMYDVNPDVYGEYLSLNIDDNDSVIDFELAKDAASYYGLPVKQAEQGIADIRAIVEKNWAQLAKEFGISRNEIERMRPAFRV